MNQKYIIKDLQKNILELGGLTDLFLSSSEVLQFLNEDETNLSIMVVESQLSRYIEGFRLSYGDVHSFCLLNKNKNSVFYFNLKNPFAEPKFTSSLIDHIDYVNNQIKPKGAFKIEHTSYELINREDDMLNLNIYRTFSPDLPIISDNTFSQNVRLNTTVVESSLDVKSRYKDSLMLDFDKDTILTIAPHDFVHKFGKEINHKISFSKNNGMILKSTSDLANINIKLSESYLKSRMSPYAKAIASLVFNVTIVTFILLKLLINRQIIKPIVSLTSRVENAISGDTSGLDKINRKDEIASLNNNYIELFSQLDDMARYDHLTGLTNRRFFNRSVSRSIEHSLRHHTKSALLFIDLDNFKAVNDSYGHHIGDSLLKSFSQRLTECFRAEDILAVRNSDHDIARLAGDEFAVLLSDMPNTDAVACAAKRICELCKDGFQLDGVNYDIRTSIGIAICPDDAITTESLLAKSDSAMYQVKKTGKNGFHFYSTALDNELKRHNVIESELKSALENHDFDLVYMPIYDCRNGHLIGAEVLLRARTELLSSCGPAEFIPVAEATGLIKDIDYWVIESAIKRLRLLIDKFQFAGILSVNFSAWQLKNRNFAKDVFAMIQKYDIPPSQLEMEITETCLVIDDKDNIALLKELKDLGVHLALDDFGTGYTAFRQLVNYPVDTLKVDRSFINAINIDNSNDRLLVDIIVELASLYDLKVVAEGVETQHHFDYIRKIGCDRAQGYFFSKPISWYEFVKLYKEYTPEDKFTKAESSHELTLKSLTGSVSVEIKNNLVFMDFKGLVTAELVDYVTNSIEKIITHLSQKKWGVIIINDGKYDLSAQVGDSLGRLVGICLENGCIESAYVIQNPETLAQIENFRHKFGLADNLKEKTFISMHEAIEYIQQKLL